MNREYFKTDKAFERFAECHNVLKSLALDMQSWCKENDCPFMITESKTTDAEDRVLNRISKTHSEGRAFDLSTKGWTLMKIQYFIAYFSHKYVNYAAIGVSGPRLILHHNNGNGDHMHIQIRPGLSLENKSKV